MSYLGIASSGSNSNDVQQRKQFKDLLKIDREQCQKFQAKESLLEDLYVSKTNKGRLKKFILKQENKDKSDQYVRTCSNLKEFLEQKRAYGIVMFFENMRYKAKALLLMCIISVLMSINNSKALVTEIDLPKYTRRRQEKGDVWDKIEKWPKSSKKSIDFLKAIK